MIRLLLGPRHTHGVRHAYCCHSPGGNTLLLLLLLLLHHHATQAATPDALSSHGCGLTQAAVQELTKGLVPVLNKPMRPVEAAVSPATQTPLQLHTPPSGLIGASNGAVHASNGTVDQVVSHEPQAEELGRDLLPLAAEVLTSTAEQVLRLQPGELSASVQVLPLPQLHPSFLAIK